MGKLTLNAFLSLDGVMQAPGDPAEDRGQGFEHGGWLVPLFTADVGSILLDIFSHAQALLIGRGTYDIFSKKWANVADPTDLVAAKLNHTPKFVASRSRSDFDWQGCTAISDAAPEVAELKQRLDGELQIHGSHGLAQTLIDENLIDEYRLFICPVILGNGKRLFQATAEAQALKLVGARSLAGGVVYTVYRPTSGFRTGSFG